MNRKSKGGSGAGHCAVSAAKGRTQHSKSNTARDYRRYFERNTVVNCNDYNSYLNLKDVEVRDKKEASSNYV